MRVPLPWLREYCDPPLDARAIEERLTMTGTKVEAIHSHGVPSTENFVVGRVLSAEQHPDADRLKVCSVDLGLPGGEPACIVCGAPNVAAGQTVAVARPGAVMPDGTKLGKAKLRGIVSEGMILAENELQIGTGGEGIMVLDGAGGPPAPGTPLENVLPISVEVLELEITPNRPDCLGVYGVARELHAASGAPLSPEPWASDPGTTGVVDHDHLAVERADLPVECLDLLTGLGAPNSERSARDARSRAARCPSEPASKCASSSAAWSSRPMATSGSAAGGSVASRVRRPA